jgi:hypothetical protein
MKLRAAMMAMAAALLLATTAQAGPFTKLYSSGSWNVWLDAANDNGDRMCTMDAEFARASGWAYVKWTARGGGFLQAWKPTWRLPDGSTVPMSVTFTGFEVISPPITGEAKALNNGSAISFNIKDLPSFLQLFGYANKMTIDFPRSNEPQWTLKMDGGRDAVRAFERCIAAPGRRAAYNSPAPTQPALPLTDAAIVDRLVQESRARYHAKGRPCACPDDRASNGTACGGRSAYSRSGGAEPLCYPRDATPAMIEAYRTRFSWSRSTKTIGFDD